MNYISSLKNLVAVCYSSLHETVVKWKNRLIKVLFSDKKGAHQKVDETAKKTIPSSSKEETTFSNDQVKNIQKASAKDNTPLSFNPTKSEEIQVKNIRIETSEPEKAQRKFYQGRVGFFNPSNRNCSYNSMAIVLAHTGIKILPERKNIRLLEVEQDLANLQHKRAALNLDQIDDQMNKDLEEKILPFTSEINDLELKLFDLESQKMQMVKRYQLSGDIVFSENGKPTLKVMGKKRSFNFRARN